MKFKLALSTATALGLLMGGALADDNRANLQQVGSDNTATITQDSNASSNRAGNPSNAGGVVKRLLQEGDTNDLVIQQTGYANSVGTRAEPGELIQTGDRNSATITQTNTATAGSAAASTGNSVVTVRQTSHADSTETSNVLSITQGASGGGQRALIQTIRQNSAAAATTDANDRNSIAINQDFTGGSNGYYNSSRVGTTEQTGSGNTLTITQTSDDTSSVSTRNHVDTVKQTGTDHTATVEQIGDANILLSLTQGNGDSNTATVKVTGDRNGTGATGTASFNVASPHTFNANHQIAGAFTAGSRASLVGLGQATVEQTGGSNTLDYVAVGNSNLFALAQRNDGNMIYSTVFGDGNQLAILQDGDGNNSNTTQSGGGNDIGVVSKGDGNTADVHHTGDNNHNSVWQDGNGNTATANVTGNDNNASGFLRAPASVLASSNGLTAGLLEQYGNNHQVSLTVNGDGNVFASLQGLRTDPSKSGNKIAATQNGSFNDAAVVQAGSNNVTSLTQAGSSNSASISQ